MATFLESANNKLAELQKLLDKSRYQLAFDSLQISDDLNQIKKVRLAIADLRRQLEKERQTKEVIALRKAIHDALVAMTRAAPLNRRTEGGQMMCPLTLQVFDSYLGVALSNGCIYESGTIGNHASDQPYFPRKLPGSNIEIDQDDVQTAQRGSKNRSIANIGQLFGFLGMVAYGLTAMMLEFFAGINLLLLAESGLLALGVGAGVAATGAVIAFVAPMLACFIIAGVLGAWYYSKHHPSQLEPSPENDRPTSSTALSFDEMDVKPEEKKEHKPELEEVQKLDDLSAEKIMSVEEVVKLVDLSALTKPSEDSTTPKLV